MVGILIGADAGPGGRLPECDRIGSVWYTAGNGGSAGIDSGLSSSKLSPALLPSALVAGNLVRITAAFHLECHSMPDFGQHVGNVRALLQVAFRNAAPDPQSIVISQLPVAEIPQH